MRNVKVGVRYCIEHDGIANEDDRVCDFKGMDGLSETACKYRQLYYRAKR